MAAPDPNVGTPAGSVMAVLFAWSEADGEFRAVTSVGGKLDTTASVATGDAPATGTITSVNDTNSDVTILAANANRKGATVFNDSTALLYLALASVTASATNYSVQVPAGGYFELPTCDGGVYTGVIKGIWASDASGAARVTEFA